VQLLADGAYVRHLDDVHACAGFLAFHKIGGFLHALHQITAKLVRHALVVFTRARRAWRGDTAGRTLRPAPAALAQRRDGGEFSHDLIVPLEAFLPVEPAERRGEPVIVRSAVASTFVAALELCRGTVVGLDQGEDFGTITVSP
jgi:hypothetical protein